MMTWALDYSNNFPFNLSTNAGGTLEYRAVGPDGFDSNAAIHFRMISNELSFPKILVCPDDKYRSPAADFNHLQSSNVSYALYTSTNINEANPTAVLAVCSVDGNILRCDGSVDLNDAKPDEFEHWKQYSLVAIVLGLLLSGVGMVLKPQPRRTTI